MVSLLFTIKRYMSIVTVLIDLAVVLVLVVIVVEVVRMMV